MKKFSVILLGLCMVVALTACKTAKNVAKQSTVGPVYYTSVDIDPATILEEWEHIVTVPLSQFIVESYFCNPDKDQPIQFATLILQPNGIGGYSYMLNGKINICKFNPGINAYESMWDTLSDESKEQWRMDYNTYFELGDNC